MEKSKLENVSDKQLFYLLKGVSESVSDISDDDYYDVCVLAAKIVGFDLEEPIDVNYIASTLKLNDNYDFSNEYESQSQDEFPPQQRPMIFPPRTSTPLSNYQPWGCFCLPTKIVVLGNSHAADF